MKNFECRGCHKRFDFDKKYGVCPKCGTFNQNREGREELYQKIHGKYDGFHIPKETTPVVTIEVVKKKNKFPLFVLLFCVIAVCCMIGYVCFGHFQIEKFMNKTMNEVMTLKAGEIISLENCDYQILKAQEIIPAGLEATLKEDEKMIGVYAKLTSKEGGDEYYTETNPPYVEYGNGFYKQCLYSSEALPYVCNYGVTTEQVLEGYMGFCDSIEGYYIYLVDKEADAVTVTLERKEKHMGEEITTGAYQIILPIEESEANIHE